MSFIYLFRKLFSKFDRLTDSLTSYKLLYWILWTFIGWGAFASLVGLGSISYKWYQILWSAFFLIIICWLVNEAIARFLNIPKNTESYAITALILALIMTPASNLAGFYVLAGVGAIAISSKYLLTFRRAHVFNPAAFGAFLMAIIFHKYASWWVGTSILTPIIFAGGWLILRKMKRYILVSAFLSVYLLLMLIHSGNGSLHHDWHLVWATLIETQLLFFAYIMLTEPMTSPTLLERYIPYAVIVAAAYGSLYWHIGNWQPVFTPEQALLIGNIFAFIFAFSPRYPLKLVKKNPEAQEIKSFVFAKPAGFNFKAGQYMEWTFPSSKSDNRGNRRYLTIASSPTEDNLMITLKMPEKRSWYKTALDEAKEGSQMLASRLSGSFTLPENKQQKLVFMAGGVGITPYRSMIKYMLDSNDIRDTRLLYAVNNPQEVAYKELLTSAKRNSIKTYVVVSNPPSHWGGLKGYITDEIIKQAVPDYKDRVFYISGPLPFVNAMEKELSKLKISARKIKTDYFPGYA